MPFADLSSELSGVLPGLSPSLADTYINRAWRSIRDSRRWSFLQAEGVVICPVQIIGGTVSVTQYSSTVTFDAAATTALAPLTSGGPIGITQCQFRTGGGELYNIIGATGSPIVATLDRIVVEPTGSGLSYQVYRAYITPPTDFLRWDSLDDFSNGYAILKDRLGWNRSDFDRRDPQRQSQGQAFYLGAYKGDGTLATPLIYELWPHPTSGQAFAATYQRMGLDFVLPTDVQPSVIGDSLIISRALGYHGYPWAQANRGLNPKWTKTDFVPLIELERASYQVELAKAKKQDDEISLQSVYRHGRGRGMGTGRPIADAKYWQSHPIFW